MGKIKENNSVQSSRKVVKGGRGVNVAQTRVYTPHHPIQLQV